MKISNTRAVRKAQDKANSVPIFKKHWRLLSAISAVVLVTILGGVYYYQSLVSPLRQPALMVDNTIIRMDYLLKRTKMAGEDPAIVLEQLTYEQIVRIMAPKYGIAVSQSDVEQALRNQATSVTGNTSENATATQITDDAFKERYNQQLETTGLSDAEYRGIIHTNLIAARFQEYLAARVPTRGEQVHLNVIVSATSADMNKAKARITAGETFATVASEVSLDGEAKVNKGDVGWIPRGLIPYDEIVFQLDVGQGSDTVLLNANAYGVRQYAIFMVSEKRTPTGK